jgi:hypothetical protein
MASSSSSDASSSSAPASASVQQAATKPRKEIFFAVDVERTGTHLISGKTCAVGFFLGNAQGKELVSKRWRLAVEWPKLGDSGVVSYGDFEPKCWDEFWAKQPKEYIESIKRAAQTQQKGWESVAAWIEKWERDYDPEKYKIVFLSDNPSFDIAAIDYALEVHTGRLPLRYSSTGEYRSVKNPMQMFDMLPHDTQAAFKKRMQEAGIVHNHDPVEDARLILHTYFEVRRFLDARAEPRVELYAAAKASSVDGSLEGLFGR